MKLLTGLFRFARKRVQTTDNDMGMFREKLTELVEKKDSLSDEEVVQRVEELKGMTTDLPDEEDKSKLDRFLEDFKSIKEQDEATAKEAASMVADLFEKLDTEAMKDVPDVGTEETPAAEEAVAEEEAPLVEGEAPEAEEAAEEVAEETVAPEGKEAEDADPNTDYTLEEIYQFIKKRMAEDACADSAEEVETEEEKKDEGVVSDHAIPFIPVTMNRSEQKGSLDDLFAKIKKGGR